MKKITTTGMALQLASKIKYKKIEENNSGTPQDEAGATGTPRDKSHRENANSSDSDRS